MSRGPGLTVSLAVAVSLVVLALDQAAKAAVRSSLDPGETRELVGSVVELTYVRNTGVAFGQFAGSGALVGVLVLVAVAGLLWYFLTHLETPLIWLPAGMVLGGAAGNLVDRIEDGAVTDYVQLPHWPAFNVADLAITLGVLLMVLVAELHARRLRKAQGRAG